MAVAIAETFQVRAPIDRVWRYLIDPRQVVACLPGAELIEVQDNGIFVGRVKVKVGPIGASFKGRAQLTEANEAEHRVRMSAEGQDSAGGGSAKMTMTSTMVALPNGVTEVKVEASVDLVGKLMQFGRGMIEGVSRQLFRQFAECVRTTLEASSVAKPRARNGEVGADSAAAPPRATSHGAPVSHQPAAARPVRVLPLMFRATWEAISRLFRGGTRTG